MSEENISDLDLGKVFWLEMEHSFFLTHALNKFHICKKAEIKIQNQCAIDLNKLQPIHMM